MKNENYAHDPLGITVLGTGDYSGRMTYVDIAATPKNVIRYYSNGAAERVYFYNEGYVRAQEVSK